MHNFCTLFDSHYLPRGLAMYESLKKHCSDFHLYIFAFDDKCFEILKKLNLDKVTVISLREFESERLLTVKSTRTRGEYCWTCTSSSILYVLEKYNVQECTYLDADIYFYANPEILLEELNDDSVLITEHGFHKKYAQGIVNGKYCVQFITFKNNEKGLKVLNDWVNKCIDWCYARYEEGKFGDQKYLDTWSEEYDCVKVLEHKGGGIAPWNIEKYTLIKSDEEIILEDISDKSQFKAIFYHYHDIKFDKNGKLSAVNYYEYDVQGNIRNVLYRPYLEHLKLISKQINLIDSKIMPCKTVEIGLSGQIKVFFHKTYNTFKLLWIYLITLPQRIKQGLRNLLQRAIRG